MSFKEFLSELTGKSKRVEGELIKTIFHLLLFSIIHSNYLNLILKPVSPKPFYTANFLKNHE